MEQKRITSRILVVFADSHISQGRLTPQFSTSFITSLNFSNHPNSSPPLSSSLLDVGASTTNIGNSIFIMENSDSGGFETLETPNIFLNPSILSLVCKTRENSNFLKNGKMVISVKIQNFSRSPMTKQISPLESSHEI